MAEPLPMSTDETTIPLVSPVALSSSIQARVAPLHANSLELAVLKIGVAGVLIQNFSVVALLWLGAMRALHLFPPISYAVLMSVCLLISALLVLWFVVAWYRAQGRLEHLG